MRLIEFKKDIVTINIDTKVIKEFNKKKLTEKLIDRYGDYNTYLIEKLENGNIDAIKESIKIISNIFTEQGVNTYENLYRKLGVK